MSLWLGTLASSGAALPDFLYVADRDNFVLSKFELDPLTNILTDVSLYDNYSGPYGQSGTIGSVPVASPWDLDTDAQGNIYLLERNIHIVRKINKTDGYSTIYAGNPTSYDPFSFTSGDHQDGFRTSAKFNRPNGIGIDKSNGIIYVADTSNHVIRKIVMSTGEVTTLVGYPGTSGFIDGNINNFSEVYLNGPKHVCPDPTGQNIYIADSDNNAIRKVNLATGSANTFAGLGSASYSGDGGPALISELNSPTYLCFNKNGTKLYIADFLNDRVRVIDMSTNTISTFAGNGTGFSNYPPDGDGGLATNASIFRPVAVAIDSSDNVYITEHDNHRIRKVDINTNIITTVGGKVYPNYSGRLGRADNAEFSYPWGIKVLNY